MKYFINGHAVSIEEWNERGPKNKDWLKDGFATSNTYRDHDPLLSDGLGVMKNQVGEMREEIHHRNIQGVLVRENGQLEITSRRGRREIMRMRGLADSDAGYGD